MDPTFVMIVAVIGFVLLAGFLTLVGRSSSEVQRLTKVIEQERKRADEASNNAALESGRRQRLESEKWCAEHRPKTGG